MKRERWSDRSEIFLTGSEADLHREFECRVGKRKDCNTPIQSQYLTSLPPQRRGIFRNEGSSQGGLFHDPSVAKHVFFIKKIPKY